MRGTSVKDSNDGSPLDMEVSRLGIVISWLAVIAILLVVGAAFDLAVQGLLFAGSVTLTLAAAACGLWLTVVTYRLVRLEPVPLATLDEGSRSRLP